MKERTLRTKLLTVLLTLCLALSFVPITAFADSGAYAVKFYPGDYGTMTKNDQIPFVYYGIDDDVNKPYYYKLNVTETETFGFVGSIMDTLLPNSGYEFAYWTADATVYQAGSGTAIPAGTALSSDQIQNSVNVRSDNVTFTAQFKQISEYPEDSVITTATIENVKFNYQLGDAPQATAWVPIDDMDKYEIDYECWQQFKGNEPVAAWYSDKGSGYTVEFGKATPAFNGTPARKGYTFAGWKPAVAATVTSNATYEATWKSDSATTTPSDNKSSTGETTSPKTGDTSNIILWAALLFVSCGTLAGTLVIDKKKKTMK